MIWEGNIMNWSECRTNRGLWNLMAIWAYTTSQRPIVDLGRGGGLAGTVWFELPACYHPNLGMFWIVWLFQEKILQKMYPTPVKSLFENTMGNQFFDFFKYWPECFKKKSRIRETSNLSTDADSSSNATIGWTKNTQKPKKMKNGKNNPKRKNSKMSRDMPKLAIYPLTRGL